MTKVERELILRAFDYVRKSWVANIESSSEMTKFLEDYKITRITHNETIVALFSDDLVNYLLKIIEENSK